MSDGPIYWHPGLFLQPQHFQIMQRRTTDALAPFVANMTPYFLGAWLRRRSTREPWPPGAWKWRESNCFSPLPPR